MPKKKSQRTSTRSKSRLPPAPTPSWLKRTRTIFKKGLEIYAKSGTEVFIYTKSKVDGQVRQISLTTRDDGDPCAHLDAIRASILGGPTQGLTRDDFDGDAGLDLLNAKSYAVFREYKPTEYAGGAPVAAPAPAPAWPRSQALVPDLTASIVVRTDSHIEVPPDSPPPSRILDPRFVSVVANPRQLYRMVVAKRKKDKAKAQLEMLQRTHADLKNHSRAFTQKDEEAPLDFLADSNGFSLPFEGFSLPFDFDFDLQGFDLGGTPLRDLLLQSPPPHEGGAPLFPETNGLDAFGTALFDGGTLSSSFPSTPFEGQDLGAPFEGQQLLSAVVSDW
jgi:hypothetical protein